METLEQVVVSMYYNNSKQWLSILKKSATEVVPAFEYGRIAREFQKLMYGTSNDVQAN